MALLKFLRGTQAGLATQSVIDGALYFTIDSHKIFMGTDSGLQEYSAIEVVSNISSLPSEPIVGKFYYAEAENVFCFKHDGEWRQVNPDTGATSIEVAGEGNAVTAASYDATTRKITLTMGETFATAEELKGLSDRVGQVPSDEAYAGMTVVGYVNKKAEETLAAAQGGSSETAASVKAALDTYKETNDAKVTANTEAITAIKDGAEMDSFADVEAAISGVETGVANLDKKIGEVAEGKTVVQMIADAQTAATYDDTQVKADITKAQGAAEAAQADVDALELAVGTIPEGETVVGMIEDASKLAGDAMTEAGKKVASITAADASVTVAGTSTAPTVAAKLSADADNVLTLAEDGLKVVIPAAAEYVIEKAEESGEYAAIYKLMKNGVQAGTSINIPKDMVVESGSVVNDPEGQPAGTYIKLVLQNVAEPLYINVASLIEYVTSGSQTGDMIVVSIDDEHKVTATITDGTVGIEKLTTETQTKINKAHSHENADVLAGITADHVADWDNAQANVIETVKVNGEALSVSEKAVDIAIPTGALASKDEVSKDDLDDALVAEINAKAVASEVTTALNGKVDKVDGQSLVDDAEIEKLAGVSAGANKVEASETNGNIKIDGVETVVYTHPAEHAIGEITGLEDALAAKLEADDIENKADKATTLAGYGIEDAMTKSEIETLLTWGSF